MPTTAFQKALDKCAAAYDREITKLINDAHAKHVVPYCDKKGYAFTAGMGGFSFDDGKGRYLDRDELPKRLRAVVSAELLYQANDAGSLMPDYRPENYPK